MGKLHFGPSVKLTSESRTDTHGELFPSLGILTLGQIEKHVLGLLWLWNDGSQDRSGIQLVRFRVQRLGVSVSLAATFRLGMRRLSGHQRPRQIETCSFSGSKKLNENILPKKNPVGSKNSAEPQTP